MSDLFVSLFVAVTAGVISHYIIKWLDSKHNDN